jgi:hypothetical protein
MQSNWASVREMVTTTPNGLDSPATGAHVEVLMDPNPDYDASDEIEYFFQFVPWGLRGVYPPPAYPPV